MLPDKLNEVMIGTKQVIKVKNRIWEANRQAEDKKGPQGDAAGDGYEAETSRRGLVCHVTLTTAPTIRGISSYIPANPES